MKRDISKNNDVKPFYFKGEPFMPYPERKPKDMQPIQCLTKDEKIVKVIQIDTGFGREFTNEKEHIHLFPEDIKGWWYI